MIVDHMIAYSCNKVSVLLHTMAKGCDHGIVKVLDTHMDVVPYNNEIKMCVVTCIQVYYKDNTCPRLRLNDVLYHS